MEEDDIDHFIKQYIKIVYKTMKKGDEKEDGR